MNHTPLPWRIYSDEESRDFPSTTHVQADDDEPNGELSVAMCVGDQHYQNSAFICQAVNAYYPMLAALEKARKDIETLNGMMWDSSDVLHTEWLDAAIKLAKGEPS